LETVYQVLYHYWQQEAFLQGSHQSTQVSAILTRSLENWCRILKVNWSQFVEGQKDFDKSYEDGTFWRKEC
jgi:hypothetical protein